MAQEQTANQSQEKRVRLVRPSIVLLCGPAACGKSTFSRKHFRPTQIISSDWARAWVCDDERDQRFQTQAFALVHYLAELRLGLNRLCVIDSTALTSLHRREYLELAKRFQVPCTVFLFDVSLEKCVERDLSRERTVGSQVIERQYSAFNQTKAEIRKEGFAQIIELGEGDLDKVQIEIIFRPIPQPPETPGRRPPGESRPAPRPWQQRTGRGPYVRETRPASPTPPPPSPGLPAKPEVVPANSPPKSAAATSGRSPAAPVAAPPRAVEPASSPSPGANQAAPGAKTSPQT